MMGAVGGPIEKEAEAQLLNRDSCSAYQHGRGIQGREMGVGCVLGGA